MIETLRKNIRYIVALATLPVVGGLFSLTQGYFDRITPPPNAPQFSDVNGDGIEDKIVQKRAGRDLILHGLRPPYYIDEIFYGIDINEQRVYVTENAYNEIMKQRRR